MEAMPGLLLVALKKHRQRQGLNTIGLKGLLSDVNFTSYSSNPLVAEIIAGLSKESGIELDAVRTLLCAVASGLGEEDRNTVSTVLNLYPTDSQTTHHDLVARRHSIAKVKLTKFTESVEEPALKRFADLLCSIDQSVVEKLGLEVDDFARFFADKKAPKEAAIVVVGLAVMDLNFAIPNPPPPGGSVQALGFRMHPGGKALTQAVACSRLGLKSKILSVVGNDYFGNEITKYLERENVDVGLLRTQAETHSAITGVFSYRADHSTAIGWKNETELTLTQSDIAKNDRDKALKNANVVLLTFELPPSTISKALQIAKEGGAKTIVTPAPPYVNTSLNLPSEGLIDFLVCNTWEASELASLPQRAVGEKFDQIVHAIFGKYKPENIVIVHADACHVYERGKVSPLVVSAHEQRMFQTAGDRDAFCAMLALQLSFQEFDLKTAVEWSILAMSCVADQLAVPESMPSMNSVKKLRHKHAQSTIAKGE